MTANWLQTSRGKIWDYDQTKHYSENLKNFSLREACRCVGRIPRFLGHTPRFYSVAEHSYRCGLILRDVVSPEVELLLLSHDLSEAYTGDIVSPIKRELRGLDELSTMDCILSSAERVVYDSLLIEDTPEALTILHAADMEMLKREMNAFFPWQPEDWNIPGYEDPGFTSTRSWISMRNPLLSYVPWGYLLYRRISRLIDQRGQCQIATSKC